MLHTIKNIPKVGEVIYYYPKENVITLAYVLNEYNNIYYLYTQNRIIGIELQHDISTDPNTGDLYDEWHEITTFQISDYCILPEIDYILKKD